jgi:hypothetical protein
MVAVSLPELATSSQFNNAIGGITEPIKRERMSNEEIRAKKSKIVSYNLFNF